LAFLAVQFKLYSGALAVQLIFLRMQVIATSAPGVDAAVSAFAETWRKNWPPMLS